MNSCRNSDPLRSNDLGDFGGSVTPAIRSRLTEAYRWIHANRPRALDMTATLLSSLHDHLSGRLRSICLAAGMSSKQYQHVDEGINGDGISVAALMVLLEAAPASVVPSLADVLGPLGYEIRRKDAIRPVATAYEDAATLAERAGSMQGLVVRALSDGYLDPQEARDVCRAAESLRSAADSMEAHPRKIGAKA